LVANYLPKFFPGKFKKTQKTLKPKKTKENKIFPGKFPNQKTKTKNHLKKRQFVINKQNKGALNKLLPLYSAVITYNLLQVFYSDFYLSTLLDRDKNNK
jgi:hypothetical protein